MTATGGLADLGVLDQAALVQRGECKPVELVEAAIARIDAVDPQLNAVVVRAFDQAVETARALPSDGSLPFAGVPFLLKDLVAECEGLPFSEGSVFLRDNVSTHDQEIVRRLKAAGFVILGTTNTPEFGLAPHCENRLYGETRNPWDVDRTPGGSSGGSAAAIASGMVPAAHGNDLGGSLRFPASACGLVGLKPTRGRVSLGPEYGDPVGAMAVEHALTRSVRDSAAILDVIHGPMLGEPFPAPPVERPFLDEVGRDPGRLRIAFSAVAAEGHDTAPECADALRTAVERCEALGHHVEEAWIPEITPELGTAIGMFYGGATAWIVEYWIRHQGREPRDDELEPFTRFLWELSRGIPVATYLLAMEDLRRYARSVAGWFTRYDLWLTPTTAQLAPPIGSMRGTETDPTAGLAVSAPFVAFPGNVANITGNPAVSIPLHLTDDGLPVGIHALGRFGEEATLLRFAAQLEAAHPWAGRRPPVFAGD